MKLNMETPSNIEPYIGTSGQDWENRFETISPHGTILNVSVGDICRYLVTSLKYLVTTLKYLVTPLKYLVTPLK